MLEGGSVDKAARTRDGVERVMAALLVGTTGALPLLFVPGLEDGYALPKAILLRAAAIVFALTFVLYLVVGGQLKFRLDRWADGALAAFVGLSAVSTVLSVDMRQSVVGEPFQYQGMVTLLLYVAAFYAARLVLRTGPRSRTLALTHVAIGGVVAAYGLAQTVGLDPFWSGPPEDRAISSVGQANDLAAYLDLVVVLGLGLWSRSGRRTRALIVAVTAMSLIGFGLTLSRGGFVALAAALVMILAFRWRKSVTTIRLSARAGLLMAVGVVATLVVGGPSIVAVADRIATTNDLQEGSIRMHLDSWRVGLAIASDRPLAGTGPETFPLVFAEYLDGVLPPDRADYLRRFRLESPHNALIGIAAESGIPALTAYLVLLGALAIRLARRAAGPHTAGGDIALTALAALVIHVATTAFKTPETSTSLLFWVIVGSALAASDPALGEDQETTGSPLPATRSTRSAARTVPDVDLMRADIAASLVARDLSPCNLLIEPVSSRSLNP
jgi:O-antigen ligase